MNTTLKYNGSVNIETIHNKYVKHNSGTKNLFRLFSNILAKEHFTSLSLPTYLMLYDLSVLDSASQERFKDDAEDDPQYHVLRSFLDLNSYTVTDSVNFETEFTAVITNSMLMNVLDNPHCLVLAVVAGNQKSLLATVTFDHTIYETVRNGGQAVVRWRMSLSNGDAESVTMNI